MEWFTVDRAGLAQILLRKGIAHVIFEPVANAFDEDGVTEVAVCLERIPSTRFCRLTVTDDAPQGFASLDAAWTLFAPSAKKATATKRGRFNAGDKLVLALAQSATIRSTTGSVEFDDRGRRASRAGRTTKGSVFSCVIRMTDAQLLECGDAAFRLIPPESVHTTFNGREIPTRPAVTTTEASLQTELADEEGVLRRGMRKTEVTVYETLPGETAHLYELGIPVCETGDRYHVSIAQKVPLDLERTAVPAAFLARVRAVVLDAVSGHLQAADSTAPWVRDALHRHGDALSTDTIRRVTALRFGDQAVAYDPSDPEANAIAVAKGYTVVHGGQMSAEEWESTRRAGLLQPAGRVTPSPKPFAEGGRELVKLPREKWTDDIEATVGYWERVGSRLLEREVSVTVANDFAWPFGAAYGGGRVTLNLARLGHKWFGGSLRTQNRLLLHELAHEESGNHLSSEYHEAICRLGAALAQLALDEPTALRASLEAKRSG